MAPILDWTHEIAFKITTGDVLSWLYLIFTILIFIVGFYVHFKVEKDRKIFLIALGFLFFFIAGLGRANDFFDNNLIKPWDIVFNFLGGLIILIAVEPLSALNHYRSTR